MAILDINYNITDSMPDFRKILIVILTVLMTACGGCNDDPDPVDEGLKITGVSIPSVINVPVNGNITITGQGFKVNDQIQFVLTTDAGSKYFSYVTAVTEQSAVIALPAGISTGSYKLTVIRGDESMLLGTTTINIITDTSIPDKPGMTVKGIVFCDGEGIPGVTVSDGYEVTVTDSEGIYYLPSQKKNGFVFISVPGNYEIAATDNIPQFFQRLAGGSTVEQKDFSLVHASNTKHVVLAMADWHLANRNDDLSQFSNGFLPDVNATISDFTIGRHQGLRPGSR